MSPVTSVVLAMSMVTEYFDGLLAQHGDSPRALDWSEDGQRERFRVLAEVGITTDKSVLDVGCGLGHFFDMFCRMGVPLREYRGIDASLAMIAKAKERLWMDAEKFSVADALSDQLSPADYVIASGVLNVEQGDNESAMRRLIRNCYDAARVAVAVNMLSMYATNKRSDRHYYDPCKWLTAALELSPRVTLRHDYRDNDFTLYIRKVPA